MVLGCGINTGLTYLTTGTLTSSSAAYACLCGALHALNPGLRLTSRVTSNAYGQYAMNTGYAYGLKKTFDHLNDNHQHQSNVPLIYKSEYYQQINEAK